MKNYCTAIPTPEDCKQSAFPIHACNCMCKLAGMSVCVCVCVCVRVRETNTRPANGNLWLCITRYSCKRVCVYTCTLGKIQSAVNSEVQKLLDRLRTCTPSCWSQFTTCFNGGRFYVTMEKKKNHKLICLLMYLYVSYRHIDFRIA